MSIPHILIVGGHEDGRAQLEADVADLVGDSVAVHVESTGADGIAKAREIVAGGDQLPVIFVGRRLADIPGSDLSIQMLDDPALAKSRRILVTDSPLLSDVDTALGRGALNGMVTAPWTKFALGEQLRAQLSTYHVEHDPDGLDIYGDLIESDDRDKAVRRVNQRLHAPEQVDRGDHILLEPQLSEQDTVDLLVQALDEALGHPARLRVSPGSVILEQGANVGGIYLILEGEVELRRQTDAGDQVVHREATGPIVGLLSVATQQRAFLEVRAVTEVRALPVSLSQLEKAVATESDVGPLLTRILIHTLANRLRDGDDLQVRINSLNASIEEERDQLADALVALGEAQEQLIEKARMATLGELASGVAHELNNPTSALIRSAEHLVEDVGELVSDPLLARHVKAAREANAVSSAERREARKLLAAELGDRGLAGRLVEAGVTDPVEAKKLAADPKSIEAFTAAQNLGSELRNISTASARIADLVDSLRAYLRGGEHSPVVDEVDITETVEDALRLLGHRLGEASVERQYQPVPLASVRPGQLQQVWTNLVANALDAAGPGANLVVAVDSPRPAEVRVRVIDDGPGVDPAIVENLFTPHFTTKGGQVSFGSGLGLSICRHIIEEHGGTLELGSADGQTTAKATIPTRATVKPEEAGQ